MEFDPNAPGAAGILILSELIDGEYVLRENPSMPDLFQRDYWLTVLIWK